MEGQNCSTYTSNFSKRTDRLQWQMLQVNGLTVINAILAAILVGVGAYGPRYRHRALVRFLFQGATALFLPILSYVASNASITDSVFATDELYNILSPGGDPETFDSGCNSWRHLYLVLIWAGLVQIVGINTCVVVVADDREGRNTGLPVALLVQAMWTSYLAVSIRDISSDTFFPTGIFALILAKVALRCYAFQKANRSLAFGRNPRLIVGYMKHQQEARRQYDGISTVDRFPPPLIVLGEDRLDVEKQPHGFTFKRMDNNMAVTGLVTLDKVWQLDNTLVTSSVPALKEVCLSFALFKLLRCRFAGYTVAKAGFPEAYSFFLHVLLKDNDHDRVLGIITAELSFLHDYYYASLPVIYSNCWLPVASTCTSLITISYCLFLTQTQVSYIRGLIVDGEENIFTSYLIVCYANCGSNMWSKYYGKIIFDLTPVLILLVLVILAEARDITSYICSNWTKVTLMCQYVNHVTWQQSPRKQKWFARLLQCQCKLMKHWDDKINQCTLLELHTRRTDPSTLLIRLLQLTDKKKRVKVPMVVKAAIVHTLRSSNGVLNGPATYLRQNLEDGGANFLWACESKGISDLILVWHIATTILGVRLQEHSPLSDDMVIATHLSRYCAYLVGYVPELLPEDDDDEWCKSLYKAVKRDFMRALAGTVLASTAVAECDKLVSMLQERAEHEVLRNGVKLGSQLVELRREGDAAAWRLLAGFWLGMILYIAPSENLNGHAEAIARGGELITLVWALLMHAGIISRPSTADAPAVAHGV